MASLGPNELMAMHSPPDLDAYWSMDDRLRVDGIAKIMPNHRYKKLTSICIWPTTQEPQHVENETTVKPLI